MNLHKMRYLAWDRAAVRAAGSKVKGQEARRFYVKSIALRGEEGRHREVSLNTLVLVSFVDLCIQFAAAQVKGVVTRPSRGNFLWRESQMPYAPQWETRSLCWLTMLEWN
ncbi:MAG TPA: hypothetical protein VFY83_12630 [Anaerolineales bacterium]|nr:hypothetical protein [Anaerolineales bacterium]